MFVSIVFILSLLYSLSSGQTTSTVNEPSIGPIYAVANNDSVLNFTFLYPQNYQFDRLSINFTIYDFISNNGSFNKFLFGQQTFTDSNFSLPWVVPNIILQSGDYVMACFEWLQTNDTDAVISDIYNCILTRAPINSTILPIANPSIQIGGITNTTANVFFYFPKELPYNELNITALLNNMTFPSTTSNLSSNNTYSYMNTINFLSLTPNTNYNVCIQYEYSNTNVSGSYQINSQCHSFQTLSEAPTGSSNKIFSSLFSMILFSLIIFI